MTDYVLAKYYKRAFLIALGLFFAAVAWIAFGPHPEQPQPSVVEKHDTIWRDTTIYEPQPAETIKTDRVVYLRIPQPGRTDTLTVHDSIDVPVPISQVRYDDSLYTAWVSGYQPALDSIRLHQPEVVTTIERTIVKPAPRWSIGPSVGAGINVTGQQQAGIFVGFSIQYRLWPK